MKSKPTISVVIPTYKESKTIQKLIRHLEASTTTTRVAEIIIADSGDSNALVLAEKSKVVVIRAKKQRAAAMNAGANIAKGSILYFLHADTYPPKGWDQNVLDATGEDIVGGCFKLRFDDKHWFMRASGQMTHLNWGWLRFGDQSLFVQKDTFFKIIHLGFGHKRKMLTHNLKEVYGTKVTELFEKLKIDEKIRAETLPIERWFEIVEQLN